MNPTTTTPSSLRGDLVFTINESSKAIPDLHPTKPWVLTASDENSTIIIWDYERRVKIVEFSVNQLDEERKESVALQRMLEKDPAYRVPIRAADTGKAEKTGQVRYLRFFDRDTRFWKAMLSKSITSHAKKGSSAQLQQAMRRAEEETIPILERHLFDSAVDHSSVIIVTEYRIIFLDYVTFKMQEIKLSALENKPQTCVDCIGKGSSVVFGGADGVLRLWDCDKWEMTKQFSGGHTKAIVKVMGYEMDGAEYLLSAGADGVVCQWNVKTGNLIIQSFGKIHHDMILDMSYATSGHLLSAGADKTIIMSEVSNGKEVCKANLKHNVGSISYFPHPHTTGHNRPVLVHYKDRGQIILLDCAQSSTNLNTSLNPTKRDNCKIYNLITHPLLPYVVFCNTNRGSAIVKIGCHPTPSVVVPTVNVEELRAYYISRQSTIQSVNINPTPGEQPAPPKEEKESKRKHLTIHKQPQLQSQQNQNVASKVTTTPAKLATTTGGVVDIALSGGGKHISLLWGGDVHRYQIFDVASWKSVDEGPAWFLSWAATGETFAIMDMVSDEKEVEERFKKTLTKKDKEKITATPTLRAVVHVCIAGTNEKKEVPNCSSAVGITGGILLGIQTQPSQPPPPIPSLSPNTTSPSGLSIIPPVPSDPLPHLPLPLTPTLSTTPSAFSTSSAANAVVSAPMPPTSSLSSANPPLPSSPSSPIPPPLAVTSASSVQNLQTLQLHDWSSLRATGPPLPAPRLIIQDKERQLLALAYDSWFVVIRLQPTIRVVNRIPHVITSGLWHKHTLIYTTPTEVRLLFPHEQEVFPLVLCSFSFTPSSVALGEREAPKEVFYRPPGFVTAAAVRDIPAHPTTLILLDSTTFKTFAVPLSFSLVQFLMAVQADKIQEAMKWPSRIEPYYHKQLARFLAVRGYATEAAQLEGLSVSTQFNIALRYNLKSTNETCFTGARAAFGEGTEAEDVENGEKRVLEKKEDRDSSSDSEEEGEEKKSEKEVGYFEDLMAADACLALGRLASDPNMSMIALKKGAEIASIAVSSLEDSVPEHQKPEIEQLKKLWQQKLKLLDLQLEAV